MKCYRIKTGPHAGEIHLGVCLNGRKRPEEPYDKSVGEGIFIAGLSLWLPRVAGPVMSLTDFLHYEDLVVPFDRFGQEIKVGSHLYVAVAKEVRRMVVRRLGKAVHVGYGHVQRALHADDLDGGKSLCHKMPCATIVFA